MTTKTPTPHAPAATKPELAAHYRPLGLKAVLAAALMLKKRPAARKTLPATGLPLEA